MAPLPDAVLHALPQWAFAFALVLARVGCAGMLLPVLGEAEVPATIRAGVVLALTLLLLPVLLPDLPAAPGPAHPTRVRTAMGVRGADVDLEMGVKRGRSLDTARATQATATATAGHPGLPAGSRQVDVGARGVALARLTQSTRGASAGGRAMGMGGGGQAWAKS